MAEQFLDIAHAGAAGQQMRGEAVAQGVGGRRLGQAQGAAQLAQLALDDARIETPAARPDEQRAIGFEVIGAIGDVFVDGGADHGEQRRHALPAALAGDRQGGVGAGLAGRYIPEIESQGLADAQAHAVEQHDQRGVALGRPGRIGESADRRDRR